MFDFQNKQEEAIFFQSVGSINIHVEEVLGTDLFLKISEKKVTVNPVLTFVSNVMYINKNNKLKFHRDYHFQIALLLKDEWLDIFFDDFQSQVPECKTILGVLTSTYDIPWYISFVKNELTGICELDIGRNGILL